MNPYIANQGRTFWKLFGALREAAHADRNFPEALRKTLAADKRFGSRDRRLYRELLYTAVRYLPWVERLAAKSEDDALKALVWLAGDASATKALKEAFISDWPELPASLEARAARLGLQEAELFPEWFATEGAGADSPGLRVLLQTRASLWLRVPAAHEAGVKAEFATLGWALKHQAGVAGAFEVSADVDVTRTKAFENGWFEIQDVGSQAILAALTIGKQERWYDACAGAGGKTLQLAALLEAGNVEAWDPRANALRELSERAQRARVRNVRVLREKPAAGSERFDGVLVDAPCSGSGTWRRSPHLKWSTSRDQIEAAAQQQEEILSANAGLVKEGGQLVYATCSLCRSENESVAQAFLAKHPEFKPGAFRTNDFHTMASSERAFLPTTLGGDGFFAAVFVRERAN